MTVSSTVRTIFFVLIFYGGFLVNKKKINGIKVWTSKAAKRSNVIQNHKSKKYFKLNLKSFLLLWFWTTLLRLAALEVLILIPFIFFIIQKIHHDISWQKKLVLTSHENWQSSTYPVKKSHRQSTHSEKISQMGRV